MKDQDLINLGIYAQANGVDVGTYLLWLIKKEGGSLGGDATAVNQLLQLTQETNTANSLNVGFFSAADLLLSIKGGTDNLDTLLSTRASSGDITALVNTQISSGETTAQWLNELTGQIESFFSNLNGTGVFASNSANVGIADLLDQSNINTGSFAGVTISEFLSDINDGIAYTNGTTTSTNDQLHILLGQTAYAGNSVAYLTQLVHNDLMDGGESASTLLRHIYDCENGNNLLGTSFRVSQVHGDLITTNDNTKLADVVENKIGLLTPIYKTGITFADLQTAIGTYFGLNPGKRLVHQSFAQSAGEYNAILYVR